MLYNYNKFCLADQLEKEIQASSITIALDSISTNDESTTINFKASLSESEELILQDIVNNHTPTVSEMEPVKVIIDSVEVDDQKRQIIRVATAQKGWSYIAHPIEFTTAKFNSLYSKDFQNNNRNNTTVKFYNNENEEVVSIEQEASIVKTVILFKPNYDYELICGSIKQIERPTTDMRVWCIGGMVEGGASTVKEFCGGINLKFIGADEQLKTDGRSSKYMIKDIENIPYQANQIQITVLHNAGIQHGIMLLLEYYRL